MTQQNENYLLKMKHDTAVFASLSLAKYFNFVGEG